MFRFALVVVLITVGASYADRHGFGGCPQIQPDPYVDFHSLLGTWYSIQDTSKSAPCIRYNITRDYSRPHHYYITQTHSSSGFVDAIGFHHDTEKTAEITVPNPQVPGVFHINVPHDLTNYEVTIFLTDNENYLATFTCRTLPLAQSLVHAWSAQILSRHKHLDVEYLEKARVRLAAYNVDPFLLDNTDQSNCAEAGSKGFFLNAASNVLGVFKNSAKKVSDNVITKTSGVFPKRPNREYEYGQYDDNMY